MSTDWLVERRAIDYSDGPLTGLAKQHMATLRDIAKTVGVSTATVSNVLNDTLYVSPELRERVLKVAREVNYQPNAMARGLRLQRSHTIGIVVPDITDPFFPAVVRGAEDVLTKAGYTLIIGNSDNDAEKEDSYYRTFLERQVEGLLTVPTSDHAPATIGQYSQRGIPVVYVDRSHSNMPGDVVRADNLEGSRRCVRHLAEMGRRSIAIITGPLALSNARERLQGYRVALRQSGLRSSKRLIREGTFDVASGFRETQDLLAVNPRPDALFISNAQMAVGALQALEASGLSCPRDVALACFDRLDVFDLLRPRVTGVAAPSYALGEASAQLVLGRISGKTTGPWQRRIFPVDLIERESSLQF